MLTIVVPDSEIWNSKDNCFETVKGQELRLEHSLISISKWESKWHIPFLVSEKQTKRVKRFQKTTEQMLDYIRCMTVNEVHDERIYFLLGEANMKKINDYINDPMTATTFAEKDKNDPDSIVAATSNFTTNEVIYYQMFELNIPLECSKWHLNRLLTLIRVVSEKKAEANDPKRYSASTAKQHRAFSSAMRRPHIPR